MQDQAAVALTSWQHSSLNKRAFRHNTTERPPPRPLSFPVRLEFDTTACLNSKAKKSKLCRNGGQDPGRVAMNYALTSGKFRLWKRGFPGREMGGFPKIHIEIICLRKTRSKAFYARRRPIVSMVETKMPEQLCSLCGGNFAQLPELRRRAFSMRHKSVASAGTVENLATILGLPARIKPAPP